MTGLPRRGRGRARARRGARGAPHARRDRSRRPALREAMAAALFVHHPYGIPIIGWMHEIERPRTASTRSPIYKRFYTPENAILVVAGDVDADEVRAPRRERPTAGSRPAASARSRLRPREPEPARRAPHHASPTRRSSSRPCSGSISCRPARTAQNGECYALELLAEVLGGGPTSYLYRKLVLERGLAVNAGAWYMASAIDDTRFSVYAVPAEGVASKSWRRPSTTCWRAPRRPRRRCESSGRRPASSPRRSIRTDSQSSLARIYGSALAIGETIEEVRRWPVEIEAVVQADLPPRPSATWSPRPLGDRLSP